MEAIPEDPRQPRKIYFPDSMPAFDLENPVQALYLKKKGVERLLSLSQTLSSEFESETRKNIEIQSMLTERSIEEYRYDSFLNKESGIDENQSLLQIDEESRQDAADLSRYDDDNETASIDWSLPGVEDRETDIRFVFDNTDYYDMELREKKILAIEAEEREEAEPRDMVTSIATHQLFKLVHFDFSMIFCGAWFP